MNSAGRFLLENEVTVMEAQTLQLVFTGVAATVPTLTVLLAMLQNNGRFNSIDKRFDDIYRYLDVRFHAVDQRFDAIEHLFDQKLARLEEVMDARLKHLEEN